MCGSRGEEWPNGFRCQWRSKQTASPLILARLSTTKEERSRWTFLLCKTKTVMALFLQEVRLMHYRRECNCVAHELAQLAK
uniref:Uncharacterized protein n=1 Tax=Oryza glumipatula TaxID=40148 RepID=A0A0E0A8Q0_9ORYZ